jgi:hypothetical protein
MKMLRGCALVFGLLVVGVLMAPLPSEAVTPPTITIDGTTATLTSRACDTGYHSCWAIPTGPYGAWTVGNVSGTNTARLMIEDNAGVGTATDKMRLRGITFSKPGGGQVIVITSNTFDAAPNDINDFQFALTSGGYFVPAPVSTLAGVGTTKNNRVQLTGVAQLSTTACVSPYTPDVGGCKALPGAKDTTPFQTNDNDHGNTSWSFSQTASSVGNCNTGNSKCAPFIRETMTIDISGDDKLFMDGHFTNFTTCRPDSPPESVPPGPPDTTPVGPVCNAVQNKMQQENDKALREELQSFDAVRATPFIPCEEEYGCGGEFQ